MLAAPMRSLLATPLVLTLSLATIGCGGGDGGRNDALIFLDRYESIDIDMASEDRRPLVLALSELAIADEEVQRARSTCVEAHEALLRAEDQQAEARRRLLEASAGGAQEVPASAAREIETAIAASDTAIQSSRELFPRCQREVRALQARYRTRPRAEH